MISVVIGINAVYLLGRLHVIVNRLQLHAVLLAQVCECIWAARMLELIIL